MLSGSLDGQTGQVKLLKLGLYAVLLEYNEFLRILVRDLEHTVLVRVERNQTGTLRRIQTDLDGHIRNVCIRDFQTDEIARTPVLCDCTGADILQRAGDGIAGNCDAGLHCLDLSAEQRGLTVFGFYGETRQGFMVFRVGKIGVRLLISRYRNALISYGLPYPKNLVL